MSITLLTQQKIDQHSDAFYKICNTQLDNFKHEAGKYPRDAQKFREAITAIKNDLLRDPDNFDLRPSIRAGLRHSPLVGHVNELVETFKGTSVQNPLPSVTSSGEELTLDDKKNIRNGALKRLSSKIDEFVNELSRKRKANEGPEEINPIQIVSQNGMKLGELDHSFRNNKPVVCVAVENNGLALEFASPELRNDEEIVFTALKQNSEALPFVGREQRAFAEAYLRVKTDGLCLRDLPDFQNNRRIVIAAIQQNPLALQFAGEEPRKDIGIVRMAVELNGLALEFAGEELREDQTITEVACTQNPLAKQFVSPKLKERIEQGILEDLERGLRRLREPMIEFFKGGGQCHPQ